VTRDHAHSSLAGLAIAAVLLAGCGSDSDNSDADAASGADQGTQPAAKLPDALAENRAQANEIIEGGEEALDEKLAELRGHPVVVNQWGSWCPPCREEFPWFADSAEAHAEEVAFLGIDMMDDLEAARQFLEEYPVPFPSVFDPDAAAIRSLGGGQGSPTTVFLDPNGEVLHVRTGQYASQEELEADIDRYALVAR
jgi:cytochrome c biogenesis protein CcmG, thiol:disulfide interchange protein DsbE